VTEAPFVVVDTSVALQWYLEDEDYIPEALALLEDYRRGRISLVAPDNIRYEFAGAVRKAISRRRISGENGRLAIDAILGLELRTVRSNSLIVMAYATAAAYRCSLYDGLYVTLAQLAQSPLVYADRRLRNTLGDRFPLGVWISDYSSPEQ
jgi:predicted nucleic acid-binding protein